MGHQFQNLYAAVLIPRDAEGAVDERAFRHELEFLLAKEIRGIVLNGATGEYCAATAEEVARLLAICHETLDGRGEFLCSIGAASFAAGRALADLACGHGARALLLPMPHFFPYAQDDLRSYCAAMAASAAAPVLLYNLPRFTTPLEPATVVDLIATEPDIIGIKDSSGNLDIFRALEGSRAHRFVGDDSVLVEALRQGVCEGGVSGVAGVLPELIRFLVFARDAENYPAAARLLEELIAQLSVFPTPWGLKLIAECRGIGPAHFLQPLSPRRERQACEFRAWFTPWWAAAERVLG
jgi:4-hydroxy-tetrahydrodipicolinate synthase